MNECCRLDRPRASFTKPRGIERLSAFLCACLGLYAGGAALGAAPCETSTYVFDPGQSTILQTGGIAGVNWAYSVQGSFQLAVDPNAGTAAFLAVDANATDDSEFHRTLDPNAVFKLTTLTGTVLDEALAFLVGYADDGSSIFVVLVFGEDGSARLVGQTIPPIGSADFFNFTIDTLAQRKYGGGTGEPNDPYLIHTVEHLNALGAQPNDYDKHLKLMADIDLSGYVYDRAVIAPDVNDVEDWFQGASFTGVFDGNGNTISNLTIEGADFLGLFGAVTWLGEIRDLGVLDVNITSSGNYVGGLAGGNAGLIVNSCSTGSVSGDEWIGGLVGYNHLEAWSPSTIANCYADVKVLGNEAIGGLVGENNVWGGQEFGIIMNCYASGSVLGASEVGGLVGYWRTHDARGSFWDVETSGLAASADGIGLTTAQMQSASTFLEAGWDFVDERENGTEDIWWIDEGQDYPRLWWELKGN